MSNLVKALQHVRRNRKVIVDNPYATHHAAEVLESEGQYSAAAAVRQIAGPLLDYSADPLEILIRLEADAAPAH